MTDEPITITLNDAQWATHEAWLAKKETRQRNQQRQRAAIAEAMHPSNSTIIPATGLWVCHGMVEFGDFDDADAEADWPDDVIRSKGGPVPVIGWRVTTLPVDGTQPGSTPNILLPDGEFEQGITDLAFGSTPQEVIAETRRLLRLDHTAWKAAVEECAAAGHRQADPQQESPMRCRCGERVVHFVKASASES